MFLLDTNIYIDALNDRAFAEEYRAFHRRHLPQLVLSVVVVHELLVGVLDLRKERVLRRLLIEPFSGRRRLHVPTYATWERAAALEQRLRKAGESVASLRLRSFTNDLLLAASARELGATIITRNARDFARISEHVDVRVCEPWPK